MHKVLHMLCWGASVACMASAVTVEEVSARLESGLEREYAVLASVQDADSAAAAIQPLAQALQELASLNDLVRENDLWNYIDSTEGVKPRIINVIQRISKEFHRLEKARFFGCKELGKLLAPQLNRDKSAER